MHVQLILTVKLPVALSTFIKRGRRFIWLLIRISIDAVLATRVPVAFRPLIAAELAAGAPIAAVRAVSSHDCNGIGIRLLGSHLIPGVG